MQEKIPDWLFRVHGVNYAELLSGKNNPSQRENKVALHFYDEILPKSGFEDFRYIVMNEWIVDKERSFLGKGDLVLTNGKNLLVVEIKAIRTSVLEERLKYLLKVIRQARYYAMIIRRYRDYNLFPDWRMNHLFKSARVHAAFYTNLDQTLTLLNSINRTNDIMRDKLLHLRKGISVQDIYNFNSLDIHNVMDLQFEEDQDDDDQEIQLIENNTNQKEKTPPVIISLIPEEQLRRIGVDNLDEIVISSEEEDEGVEKINNHNVRNNRGDDIIFSGEIKPVQPDIMILGRNESTY